MPNSPVKRLRLFRTQVCFVAIATALIVMTASESWGAAGSDRLNAGESLAAGQSLTSGSVVLTMQTDGNLVEYGLGSQVVWSTNTYGNPNSVVVQQTDGNLVVYAPGNYPVWASGTWGQPGSILILQSDGNLVVYAPGNVPIWSNDKYHQTYAANYGYTAYGWAEFSCLDSLWINESNWYKFATNPSSGAYGIPQALPGNKMASAGADWQTNGFTQIRWGESYIKSRYGTPCSALNAWLSRSPHWY